MTELVRTVSKNPYTEVSPSHERGSFNWVLLDRTDRPRVVLRVSVGHAPKCLPVTDALFSCKGEGANCVDSAECSLETLSLTKSTPTQHYYFI